MAEDAKYETALNTGVKICIARVPVERRQEEKYKQELSDLKDRLSKDPYLDLFSIHEAGHLTYFEKAGISEFDYIGPLVDYIAPDDAKQIAEDFIGQWAAVRPTKAPEPDGIHEDKQLLRNWLFLLAKAYAAGGRCAVNMTSTDYAGDRNDFRQLVRVYNAYLGVSLDHSKEACSNWRKARREINRELADNQFKEQIRNRALTEVKARLYFPLVPYRCP